MYPRVALWVIMLGACSFQHGVAPLDSTRPPDDAPAPDAPGCAATTVEAGNDHTCALTRDGSLYCWGRGEEGQVGLAALPERCAGTTYCQRTPAELDVPGVTAIGLGALHTCAATLTEAYCWGRNASGQYGNGTTVTSITPLAVPARAGAIAIAAGSLHTCSLAAGEVACAGGNTEGQVGNMSVVGQPTTVVVKTNATSLGVGSATSCAVDITRQLYCWGRNAYRTVDPNSTTIKTTPVLVPGLVDVDQVAAGADHLCAVTGGTLKCWGLNTSGQIGNGQMNNINQPQPITTVALANVVEVSAARNHTCARTGTGDVYCFGEGYTPFPTRIASGASRITSGADHDCAVVDGTVQCWGSQLYGQLGNGVDSAVRATSPQLAAICR